MAARKLVSSLAQALAVVLVGAAGAASAADIQFLCPPSLRPVMSELAPAFEAASGHRVALRWEVMPTMKRQIDSGRCS